jgi:chromosome segregation ATPase
MSARVDKNLLRIRDESDFVDGVGRRIEESSKRLEVIEKQIPDLQQGFAAHAREELGVVRTEIVADAGEKVASLSLQLTESEKKVKDFSAYMARLEAREDQTEKERLAGLGKALNAFELDLKGKLAGAAQRAETLEDEVFARLSGRIQEDESAVAKSIQTIEMRLSDYQGDVDYRVKALEESNHDVDALRASLTQTMEKMAAGVRTEMKAMSAELIAGWTAEIAGASTAREQLRAGMADLETGLVGLKTRAYQDVEKKLSVFEDQFFADLRTRSTSMQEKLQAWQTEMETRASAFETDVKERVTAADESIQTLRESTRQEMEKVKKDATQSFEKDLAGVRDTVEAGTRKMHREIEARLKELAVELDAGRKEIAELFEASRAEVTVWEGKARQQLADAEVAIAEKISALSGEAGSSIGSIRDGFAAQREDLLARMRDVQTEVEGRIKEHKLQLTDTREKSEAMQEKLFGKIEESYRLLSVNITEIDKRVKNFMSQTRLFERADSLKAALEGTIDEMKKEMGKLNADRSEITEIEVQLSRTKKLADEVSVKLTRFLSEKRRIEDMDGEFKKIMALSRDVDLKINTLSSSNDALQQIQAKIRQFEDMGKAVEGGFERLEKKREILSITSEGVDRNFQRLEGMEKSLQEADRAADDLVAKVQDLRSEYDTLAGNKKDADSAMETVGKLHGIMAELESRLEKAQSSREWMARTETRFEEIGRQAQEQVRLLESIIKAETKKEKPDRGAPPLDKRETVVKLSHQGWSVQEISRVTQLSRGEVELILELAPKV